MAYRRLRGKPGTAYLFLTPWLIGLLAFTIIPIGASLYLSFTDYDLFTTPRFVGFRNYVDMFTVDRRFGNSLGVTFRYVFLGVFLELLFGLFLALVLNKGVKGLRFYRSVYYLPSLVGGSVAIAILWRQVFGAYGFINDILAWFSIEGQAWIARPEYALYTLIILKAWQFGAPMLIFLAGLRGIPAELYESATVDGASMIQQFVRITIPMLTPVIFFNLVMRMISAFQAFTHAYIISGGTGGPLDSTLFYTLYLYQQGFANFKMGYASALAWVLVVIISFFTAIAFWSGKFWVYYENE